MRYSTTLVDSRKLTPHDAINLIGLLDGVTNMLFAPRPRVKFSARCLHRATPELQQGSLFENVPWWAITTLRIHVVLALLLILLLIVFPCVVLLRVRIMLRLSHFFLTLSPPFPLLPRSATCRNSTFEFARIVLVPIPALRDHGDALRPF